MSLFPPANPTVHIYRDASGTFGCGVFNLSLGWFQLQWLPAWHDIGTAAKEMLPVVAAAAVWGQKWCRTHVSFQVDNMAVVSVL